ncbi:MAG: M1 family metallopeptidase [Patescibacteria group bacterium]
MAKKVKRLFEQFSPDNYNLSIDINEDDLTFQGKVVITGKIKGRPKKRLTLHQKDLSISNASISHIDKKGAKKQIEIDRINKHASYDEVRLHTKSLLYSGSVEINVNFSGKITDQMHGIYPCHYNEHGQNKKLIATQFESHHAREVFPCIDEPEAKATFDLEVTADENSTILGNTNPIKSSVNKGRQSVLFGTTPLMSTYLLAWVVGELEYIEAKTKNNIAIRTYATKEHIDSTKFALDFAVKTLEFYEDYFGIAYPLPKCDFVALPDFASGAMENWGLITFREECLYVNDQTSLHTKQYVAMVVAHELAHQWFGNLVTMRWWTDLWLNEGFASWVEFLAVNKIFPEWNIWDQFLSDEQQRALKLDALDNTHPVEVEVNHPDEIRTIFDTISYSKGASVIHMLNSYLGDKKFQRGLQNYLKKHAYGNTDTIDLWTALEETSKMPVISFMSKWTRKSGFPVVMSDGDKISQGRFFIDPDHTKDNITWPIPLGINSTILETKDSKAHANAIYNKDRSGFYRTVYEGKALEYVLAQLKDLPDIARMGIISDMAESSKAGYANSVDTLKIIDSLKQEESYVVWEAMVGFISNMKNGMKSKEINELIKPYKLKLTKNNYEKLGWQHTKDDTHLQKLLRSLIIGVNCSADNPDAIKKCQEVYRDFIDGEKPIDPDIRSAVLTTVARHGDQGTFDELVKIHNNSTSSEEKHVLSAALTNFKQEPQITQALEMIRSDHVRLQDIGHWIAYGFANIYAFKSTWKWVKENWDWLEQNLGSDMSFSRMPIYVANHISDKKLLEDYCKFFDANNSKSIERAYAQGKEMINSKIAWRERDEVKIKNYLQEI